jgi:hypothetical protein
LDFLFPGQGLGVEFGWFFSVSELFGFSGLDSVFQDQAQVFLRLGFRLVLVNQDNQYLIFQDLDSGCCLIAR